MRSFSRTIVLSAAIAATPFLVPSSASAAIWTGATNNVWTTGTNWDTNSDPVGGDVYFNTKGSITNPSLNATRSINSVTFNDTGWNIDGGNTLNIRGLSLSATSATAGISPNVKLDVPSTVSVASGSVLTINGGFFFNNQGMTKDGTGTAVLNPSGNPAVKTISVNAGTLLLNGWNGAGSFATPSLTVAANTTFGGTANLAGGTALVTASVSGKVSPANTTATTGLLTMSGASTFNSGSTLEMQLNGVTAGTNYDQYATNGLTLNMTGSNSNVSLALALGFDPTVGNSFTLVDNTSSLPVSGQYKLGSATLVEGSTFDLTNPGTSNAFRFQLSYLGSTGNDVVATVVPIPEPSNFAMLAMGIASFVSCRRRRMA